jgi:2-desacetyl-2-hydroxyethyl bacteriochlorophyllide A dehydrogenase
MRRVLFTGPGRYELGSGPDPRPGPGEVVIRVEACGICGTDRSIVNGNYPIDFPITLGHEYAGTVVETGTAVRTLRVGQRVGVDPNVVCGVCAFCRRGHTNLCSNLTPLGIVRSGGYAEFSAVPEQNAYAIPDAMSFEDGGMLEPLACSIRGLQLAQIELGDVVVVLGGGPMGCLLIQLARLRGAASVIVSEPNEARRALALQLGADLGLGPGPELREWVLERTGGLGADVVFEAAGKTAAAEAALSLVRRGGTVMWFGSCPEGERLAVSPFWVNDAEVSIRGSFNNPFTHATAVALVASGRVNVSKLVTDRVPLEQLGAALDLANYPNAMKIAVMPWLRA